MAIGGVGAASGGTEKKVPFKQVYGKAIPDYLTGKTPYKGDETTQRYYKQLKNLSGSSEANSCTTLSYDA